MNIETKSLEEKVYSNLKNEIKSRQPDVRILPVMPDKESVKDARQLTLVGPDVDLTLLCDQAHLAEAFGLSVKSQKVKRSGANVVASIILAHYTD